MRKKKNRGSILIEAVISMFLLVSIMVFASSSYLKSFNAYKNRIKSEKINRTADMIMKELKYNAKMEEVEEAALENKTFLYKDTLDEELTEKNFLDGEQGENIKITKEKEHPWGSEYELEINITEENFEFNKQYHFEKSWWMDLKNDEKDEDDEKERDNNS